MWLTENLKNHKTKNIFFKRDVFFLFNCCQDQKLKDIHVDKVQRVDDSFSFGLRGGTPHNNIRTKLLTPVPKTLLESISEGACSVQMATEPVKDWGMPFLNFLKQGRLSNDLIKRIENKRRATKSSILKNVLFRPSLDGIPLRCIGNYEIHEAVSEVQYCVCEVDLSSICNSKGWDLLAYNDPRL